MKEGRYTIQFAQNETISMHYYNKVTVKFQSNQASNRNYNFESSSTLLTPESPEFKECFDYHVQTSLNYNVNELDEDGDINKDEYWRKYILCEKLSEDSERKTHLQYDDIQMVPSESEKCTLAWFPNGTLLQHEGGTFKVTYLQVSSNARGYNITFPDFELGSGEDLMFLTCQVEYYKTRLRLDSERGVKFAIPFMVPRFVSRGIRNTELNWPQHSKLREMGRTKMSYGTKTAVCLIFLLLLCAIPFVIIKCNSRKSKS